MRDVTFFVERINARLSRKLKLEAALHGIPMEGVVEEEGFEKPPLTPAQKEAMAKALKAAQERVKAGGPK